MNNNLSVKSPRRKVSRLSVVVLVMSAWAMQLSPLTIASDFFEFKGDALQRPTGYREWVFVGTPVTPNDMNDGKAAFPEFHNVYIDPISWGVWKDKGEFPQDTILIKELVDVGTKAASSGNGYFQGNYIGLEAVIKSAERFADEPGNWAYFSFSSEAGKSLKTQATPFPTESCNACHQVAADDDYVFTQHYPVLRVGKGAGEDATGGM